LKQLNYLEIGLFMKLQDNLTSLMTTQLDAGASTVVLTYASICSGVGMECTALHTVKNIWKRRLGIEIEVLLLFMVEHTLEKQKFLIRERKPRHMFGDVLTLMDSDTAYDVIGKSWVSIPRPNLLFMGIECDPYSGLNTNKSSSAGTVECDPLMAASLKLVDRLEPDAVVYENIRNIDSNAKQGEPHVDSVWQSLTRSLERRSYYVTDELLNPIGYGAPHHRPRLYKSGIRNVPRDVGRRTDTITSQMRIPMMPLEAFALPADHPAIEEWRQHRMQSVKVVDPEKDKSKEWPVDHSEVIG
jgi:site-specific DNA-cytosine methylase